MGGNFRNCVSGDRFAFSAGDGAETFCVKQKKKLPFGPGGQEKRTKKKRGMRGKKIADLFTKEELRKKQRRGPTDDDNACGNTEDPSIAMKFSKATARLMRLVRRFAIVALLMAFVLVLHRNQQFHASATVFFNTAGHTELVRSISTALPLSIATAVVAVWIAN
jgi:hypothetical protein